MLSLLEANATASEFLSLLQSANAQDDVVERRLSFADIKRRFDNLLNDRARLEYAALLHVTRVHFSNLELHELLGLVSATSRFALDLSGMEMSTLANDIEGSFLNKELGHAMAMELLTRIASTADLLQNGAIPARVAPGSARSKRA